MGRIVRFLERLFAKVGVIALLVSPDVVVSTLAGAAGVSPALFVVFNVAGTFVTVFVARWFGAAFEKEILAILAFFEAHLVFVTLASIAFVVLMNQLSRRQKQ
jgi:membrane protein DedA with SNARE-associated domain